MQNYYVYIIEMENGNYYTGYTNDLSARFEKHQQGLGAKFTRAFKPKKIVQSWKFEDKSSAMKAECFIKKQKRQDKELLIKNPKSLYKKLEAAGLCARV